MKYEGNDQEPLSQRERAFAEGVLSYTTGYNRRNVPEIKVIAGLTALAALGLVGLDKYQTATNNDSRQVPIIEQHYTNNQINTEGISQKDLFGKAEESKQLLYDLKARTNGVLTSAEGENPWQAVKDQTLKTLALYTAVAQKDPSTREAEEAQRKAESLYLDAVLQMAKPGDTFRIGNRYEITVVKKTLIESEGEGFGGADVTYLVTDFEDDKKYLGRVNTKGRDYALKANDGLEGLLK